MLDDPHLLRLDVELLADLGADLDQRRAVMRADAFRNRQFVAGDLPQQRRVQWLAPALGTPVGADHDAVGVALRCRRGRRAERLRLVEKLVALLATPGFALGREQPAPRRLQLGAQQIAFTPYAPQLAFQRRHRRAHGIAFGTQRRDSFRRD